MSRKGDHRDGCPSFVTNGLLNERRTMIKA